MKYLVVTLEYPPQVGGIATYLINFLEHTPDECVVLAPREVNDGIFDKQFSWKVYRKKMLASFFWPRWIKTCWQTYRVCKREKIGSLLIQHVLPLGYVGIFIKKILGIDFTVFLHGTDVNSAIKNAWKRKMFKRICGEARHIIVNSIFLKRRIDAIIGDTGKVRVLYPAAGDAFFVRHTKENIQVLRSELALTGKNVVLTVARMVDGKGYPFMVRAMAKVIETLPNTVWVVVGDGEKRNLVVTLVQEYNIQSSTRFLGAVDAGRMPLLYQSADVFMLLTHSDDMAEEAWGTVFMEAAASGIPAIAGRVGGVEEAVESGVSGIVVDVRQEKMVAQSIIDLMRNEEFRKRMGVQARERALEEFTWDKQIRTLYV